MTYTCKAFHNNIRCLDSDRAICITPQPGYLIRSYITILYICENLTWQFLSFFLFFLPTFPTKCKQPFILSITFPEIRKFPHKTVYFGFQLLWMFFIPFSLGKFPYSLSLLSVSTKPFLRRCSKRLLDLPWFFLFPNEMFSKRLRVFHSADCQQATYVYSHSLLMNTEYSA